MARGKWQAWNMSWNMTASFFSLRPDEYVSVVGEGGVEVSEVSGVSGVSGVSEVSEVREVSEDRKEGRKEGRQRGSVHCTALSESTVRHPPFCSNDLSLSRCTCMLPHAVSKQLRSLLWCNCPTYCTSACLARDTQRL